MATTSFGDEARPAGNNAQNPAEAKPAPDPSADAVERLALAHALIEYARNSKSPAPEALVTAARILAETSTQALDAKPTTVQDSPSGTAGEKQAREPKLPEPAELLAEAVSMSSGDPHIVALAERVPRTRGALGGPKMTIEQVKAFSTDEYRIGFAAGEVARVAVSGDGDTDLDLYIYDENGNLIESDADYTDDCIATWVPRWSGPFIIRVQNRGGVYNEYVIATN